MVFLEELLSEISFGYRCKLGRGFEYKESKKYGYKFTSQMNGVKSSHTAVDRIVGNDVRIDQVAEMPGILKV